MAHATIEPGARLNIPWNRDFNGLVYVLSGRGTVTDQHGGRIDLAPGVIGVLDAGDLTHWEITEPLRKVWIVASS